MKRNMLMAVSVMLIAGMTLGGCGKSKDESAESKSEPYILSSEKVVGESKAEDTEEIPEDKEAVEEIPEEQEEEEVIVIEEEALATNEQAKQAGQTLYEKARGYAEAGDEAGFSSLYINTDQDTITTDYNSCKEWINDGYPDYQYYTVCGDGQYFYVGIMNSLTTGTAPDTRSMWNNGASTISYKDGEWKFDMSEEASAIINEKVMEVYPKGLLDAANNGRNATSFERDFSWVDSKVTVLGAFDARVYYAWQEEDGSVNVCVSVRNGTDGIQAVKNMAVTLTDENLGEIINESYAGESIAPHTSKFYTINIPAENIKTGTEQWGSVGCSCDCTY